MNSKFNFADRPFLVFCGNLYLQLGKPGFSCWGSIFEIIIFRVRSTGIKTFSFFVCVHGIEIQVKQHADISTWAPA